MGYFGSIAVGGALIGVWSVEVDESIARDGYILAPPTG